MANPFLEERLSVRVRYGSSYGDDYSVEVTETSGGQEHRRLVQPYPKRYFNIAYIATDEEIGARVVDLYHRAYGKFSGFRVRATDDYSTNAETGTPTAADQELSLVSEGVYQLRKEYGGSGAVLDIGRPERTIFKPVAGTTLVLIRNAITGDHPVTAPTVDTATGQVTMPANKTDTITAISKAANAVLTIGSHSFIVGDSAHVSGVAGMTQINGRRANVTATSGTSITLAIDSTAFSDYTSGGEVNTRPQEDEEVWGGCEFDIPCRFNNRVQIEMTDQGIRSASDIELVELISL